MTRLELLNLMTAHAREQKYEIALARPDVSSTGDLDILIEEKSLKNMVSFLVDQNGAMVVSCYRRVDGMTLALYGVDSGFVGVDFITKLALKGTSYASVRECLLRANMDANGISMLHPVDLALILLMTHGIKHKGALKMAYITHIREAFRNFETALSEKLVLLFGDENALDIIECIRSENFDTLSYRKLKHYFLWSDHSFAKHLRWVAYVCYEMECRLLAPKAAIAFYGIDGSGKTTLIHEIKNKMAGATRFIRHCHFLPLLPDQVEPDSNISVKNPHAKPNRNAIMSFFKLIYLVVRYGVGSLWPWRGSVTFLYDRYLPDIIVDPRRYRYGGSPRMVWNAWYFTPKPIMSVFVDTAPETAHKRKNEMPIMEAKRQSDAYRALMPHMGGAITVRGDTPVAQNAQLVIQHMVTMMHERVKAA